jgi:hypothetical protein
MLHLHRSSARAIAAGSIARLGRTVLAAAALALGGAATANAAPITYQYASGQATITVTAGVTALGTATLNLNGVFATFDAALPSLTNFQFTTAPNQWITLVNLFGGFDQIWVNSGSLVPGTGYGTVSGTNLGSGHYLVSVAPVVVNGVYTGRNSQNNTSAGPFPISYTNATPLNATIDVIGGNFTLQGITLGIVPVPGEQFPAVIKADITFRGATPVPEATTGALLALAAVGLLARRHQTVRRAEGC